MYNSNHHTGFGPEVKEATPAQIGFIISLMEQKRLTDEQRRKAKEQMEAGLSRYNASRWINRLREIPNKILYGGDEAGPTADKELKTVRLYTGEVIPAGHYAVDSPEVQDFINEVNFFHVWVGDHGGWAIFHQVGDERFKLNHGRREQIINLIGANPEAAAKLYGHELGKCGICNRTLTNDESRKLGIGPVCAERANW